MGNTPLTIPALIERGKWDDYRQGIWGDSFTWAFERATTAVQYVVIHHSVTNVPYKDANGNIVNANRSSWTARQYADEIALIHKNRGWAGVGYHFIIAPDGMVMYVGDVSTGRANVLDNNEKVIGICLVGDFTKHLPTDDQIKSAHDLTWYFINNGSVWPNLKQPYEVGVIGHKDCAAIFGIPGTACPGSSWPIDLKDRIKNNVVYTPQPVEPPSAPTPPVTPPDLPAPTPPVTPPPPSDPCEGMILESECALRISNNDVNWQVKFNEAEQKWIKQKNEIAAAYAVEKQTYDTEISTLKEKISAYEAGKPEPQTWQEKLTSRKFIAYLASLLPSVLGMIFGQLDPQAGITAIIVCSFGYMGINVADSFAYSNQVKNQTALLNAQTAAATEVRLEAENRPIS